MPTAAERISDSKRSPAVRSPEAATLSSPPPPSVISDTQRTLKTFSQSTTERRSDATTPRMNRFASSTGPTLGVRGQPDSRRRGHVSPPPPMASSPSGVGSLNAFRHRSQGPPTERYTVPRLGARSQQHKAAASSLTQAFAANRSPRVTDSESAWTEDVCTTAGGDSPAPHLSAVESKPAPVKHASNVAFTTRKGPHEAPAQDSGAATLKPTPPPSRKASSLKGSTGSTSRIKGSQSLTEVNEIDVTEDGALHKSPGVSAVVVPISAGETAPHTKSSGMFRRRASFKARAAETSPAGTPGRGPEEKCGSPAPGPTVTPSPTTSPPLPHPPTTPSPATVSLSQTPQGKSSQTARAATGSPSPSSGSKDPVKPRTVVGEAENPAMRVLSRTASSRTMDISPKVTPPVPVSLPTPLTTNFTQSAGDSPAHMGTSSTKPVTQGPLASPTSTVAAPPPHDAAPHSGSQTQGHRPPRPLRNFGATCYMNATLQCLLYTPHLISALELDIQRVANEPGARGGSSMEVKATQEEEPGETTGGQVTNTEALSPQSTTDHRRQSYVDVHAPASASLIQLARGPESIPTGQLLLSIKGSAATYNDEFAGNGQNDAHEFLRTLLYVIHDEVNRGQGRSARYEELKDVEKETEEEAMARWMKRLRTVDDSTIYDNFGGVVRSRCECLTCGFVSMTFDPFLDLSLPIANTVGRGTGPTGSPTTTGSPVTCTGASAAPEAVDLILREGFCEDTVENLSGGNQLLCAKCKALRDGTRRSRVLRWPRTLVLHLNRFDDRGRKNRARVIYPQTFMLEDDVRYCLFAVCCHSGSENFGHYTSYVNLSSPASGGGSESSTEAHPRPNGASLMSDGALGEGPRTYARRFRGQIPHWYLCNDDRISEVDAKEAVSALENAYLLFYHRQ